MTPRAGPPVAGRRSSFVASRSSPVSSLPSFPGIASDFPVSLAAPARMQAATPSPDADPQPFAALLDAAASVPANPAAATATPPAPAASPAPVNPPQGAQQTSASAPPVNPPQAAQQTSAPANGGNNGNFHSGSTARGERAKGCERKRERATRWRECRRLPRRKRFQARERRGQCRRNAKRTGAAEEWRRPAGNCRQ